MSNSTSKNGLLEGFRESVEVGEYLETIVLDHLPQETDGPVVRRVPFPGHWNLTLLIDVNCAADVIAEAVKNRGIEIPDTKN